LSLIAIALAFLVGGLAGGLSGLLGIGGGTILVPFLYLLMANPEWSGVWVEPMHQATLAHATSLAVILPTAISGLVAFRRQGVVDLGAIVPLGLAAAVAALFGAALAVRIDGGLLKVGFGVLVLWIGSRMLREGWGTPKPLAEVQPQGSAAMRPGVALFGGGLVGLLSALLGIGGGVVAVPLLLRLARMDLHRVTAASIGIVGFAAPAGILSYMIVGWSVEGLPPGSMGFISLPLAAGLIPGAVLMAPLGARLNQRLPVRTLRKIFSAYLLTMGARLLWQYLPPFLGN